MMFNTQHKMRTAFIVGAAAMIAGCASGDKPMSAPDLPTDDGSTRANATTPGEPWDLINGTTNTINGAVWSYPVPFNVGTGQINPFLSVQAAGSEECFNTDATLPLDCTRPQFTNKLALNTVPVIKVGAAYFRELILDANESNSLPDGQFSIDLFDLYLCKDNDAPNFSTITQFTTNVNCSRVYDTREGGNPLWAKATDAATKGSGNALDYRILIPEQKFITAGAILDGGAGIETACPYNPAAADCGYYLVLHTKMGLQGGEWVTGSTFEEVSTIARPYIAVSKTATPAFTRTYSWQITKTASPTSLTLWTGGNGDVAYTVNAVRNQQDGGYSVTGTIVVNNPSSASVQINKPIDVISGNIAATVTCPGGEGPYTIAAGATLNCTYSATLPDMTTRTNTVNVEIIDGAVSSATAAIDFTGVTPTPIGFASTAVTDSRQGALGTADGSQTFNYTRNYTCGSTAGSRVEENVATLVSPNLTDDASVTVNCVALVVTKNATPTFAVSYSWAIDKTVTPTTMNLFNGDTQVASYNVVATRTTSGQTYGVNGTISVANPSTIPLEVTSLTDVLSGPVNATVVCGGGNPTGAAPKTIAAGGTLQCTYSASLPNADTRTNTATATGRIPSTMSTQNFSGTAPVNFAGVTPSVTGYPSVTVTDTYGGNTTTLGTASAEGPNAFPYTRTLACPADAGAKLNTARIVQTNQTDDATVTVTCRALTVTKTATTSFKRSFTWQILKARGVIGEATAPASLILDGGQVFQYPFAATVSTTGYTDSEWRANGTIAIASPSGAPTRTINSLTDVVSGPFAGTPTCTGGDFPRTIAGGATINCTYGPINLPDATARTNTATATLQNVSLTSAGVATPTGTTQWSGTAPVSFSATPTTRVNDCVNVSDLGQLNGFPASAVTQQLGTFCVPDGAATSATKTYNYIDAIGPLSTYGACGTYRYDNTAKFVTNTTGTEGTSSVQTPITWDCPAGCTLTQGYWKTHNASFGVRGSTRKGPPIHDWSDNTAYANWNTWRFFGGVPTAVPFPEVGPTTWYTTFVTPPKGNPYYQASHQFMAALLNVANGAGAPAGVSTALANATTFFLSASPTTAWTDEQRTQLLGWNSLFGSYNEGSIAGFPHCSEDASSAP